MATASNILAVCLLVEQDAETGKHVPFSLSQTDEEIRKAILAAVTVAMSSRLDVSVSWQSMTTVPLDGKPAVGRCAICNRWVYDIENVTKWTPTQICPGAVVDTQ